MGGREVGVRELVNGPECGRGRVWYAGDREVGCERGGGAQEDTPGEVVYRVEEGEVGAAGCGGWRVWRFGVGGGGGVRCRGN